MITKTKRPKSKIIKSSAAILLKQVSGYRCDLPIGDLRTKLSVIEQEVEQLSARIEEIFPDLEVDSE